MSNYDWETLPGFDIGVGAEIVNGTGEVRVNAHQDDDTVIVDMTADQALNFARLLARKAHEAMGAKFVNDHLTSG